MRRLGRAAACVQRPAELGRDRGVDRSHLCCESTVDRRPAAEHQGGLSRRHPPRGTVNSWSRADANPHPLTKLLLPALEASGHGRIVTVSTRAAGGLDLSDIQYERRRYCGIGAYRASKQASRMLTWALAERLRGTPVTANALDPGYGLTERRRTSLAL
jgi:short chain dehydrogenase